MVSDMLAAMEKNRRIIETDIDSLVFYMNGGLDYNDAWLLTMEQRKSMTSVVQKHYEAMNPKKTSQL